MTIAPPPTPSVPTPPFYTRYGFSRPPAGDVHLRIEPYAGICRGGHLMRTVLVSAVDLVASLFVREAAGNDATFTSDLSLRAPIAGIPSVLDVRGEVLRSGSRLITTEVRVEADGQIFALGESTFSRIPRKGPGRPRLEDLRIPRVFESHPVEQPLDEEVGIVRSQGTPGIVTLPLRPELLNPEGIFQGALVGLLIESAAQSLAPEASIVEEMDLRYLAAGKAGPIEAQASWIESTDPEGAPGRERRMMRVLLRDLGQSGRLTVSALVRIASPGIP